MRSSDLSDALWTRRLSVCRVRFFAEAMFGIVLNPECSHLKAVDYIYFAMIKQRGAYVYGLVTKKTGTVVYVVLERYAAIGQK